LWVGDLGDEWEMIKQMEPGETPKQPRATPMQSGVMQAKRWYLAGRKTAAVRLGRRGGSSQADGHFKIAAALRTRLVRWSGAVSD